MSRIGKQLIALPDGVTATIADGMVTIKGPKGELKQALHPLVTVKQAEEGITVHVTNEEKKSERAFWGLFASLIVNMVVGVTEGYEKKLEINGVGYRVAKQGNGLKFELGFSHPIEFPMPEGVNAEVEKNIVIISGIDKQKVGQVAADIRKLRKPEPYKGKGIKYVDEIIRRKAGKAAKAAA